MRLLDLLFGRFFERLFGRLDGRTSVPAAPAGRPAPQDTASADGLTAEQQALLTQAEPLRAAWFTTDTAVLSDSGPVRSNNEDSVLALSQTLAEVATTRTCLIALADGMGGHQAGETASRIAVESALATHRQPSADNSARRLLRAVEQANRDVHAHSLTSAEFEGMGTTLVLLSLTDAGAYCSWVGDSRLYRLRAGRLELLTRDDTLVRELVDGGLIQAHEAQDHPDRSVLSQAMGTKPSLRRLNLIGPMEMRVGDCFLLCSDGLHDVVPDTCLTQVLAQDSASAICQELLRQALLHHADDNITTAVVRILALDSPRSDARDTVVPGSPA